MLYRALARHLCGEDENGYREQKNREKKLNNTRAIKGTGNEVCLIHAFLSLGVGGRGCSVRTFFV